MSGIGPFQPVGNHVYDSAGNRIRGVWSQEHCQNDLNNQLLRRQLNVTNQNALEVIQSLMDRWHTTRKRVQDVIAIEANRKHEWLSDQTGTWETTFYRQIAQAAALGIIDDDTATQFHALRILDNTVKHEAKPPRRSHEPRSGRRGDC